MSSERLPREFAGFFEHARQGSLAFPRCAACARFHWYPMPVCPHCRHADVTWQPISGPGEIFSFTTVRHAFEPTRRSRLPYVVALVTFEDAPGVQLVTNIIDSPPEAIAIGARVQPVFPPPDAGEPAVLFRVVTGEPGAT